MVFIFLFMDEVLVLCLRCTNTHRIINNIVNTIKISPAYEEEEKSAVGKLKRL